MHSRLPLMASVCASSGSQRKITGRAPARQSRFTFQSPTFKPQMSNNEYYNAANPAQPLMETAGDRGARRSSSHVGGHCCRQPRFVGTAASVRRRPDDRRAHFGARSSRARQAESRRKVVVAPGFATNEPIKPVRPETSVHFSTRRKLSQSNN